MQKGILTTLFILATSISLFAQAQSVAPASSYNLTTDKVLYSVGYSHLDTEWNWDYPTVINEYIKNTMTENFSLFEKYPDYRFNFTGSRRYHMMKEYYPELYANVKKYVASGQWYISGSSVDEAETLMSTPESIIRQVLYGNGFFKKEFGKQSMDYMLPDCFGFPASLPSIIHHTGLLGFSTQKLAWGSAVGIPFNVGTWRGPDGNGILAALNGGWYTGTIPSRFDLDETLSKRLDDNKKKTGYAFDFRYYGVGDQGGAPRENDVKHALASQNHADSKFKLLLTSSDQMFKDITPQIQKQLPTYKGDLLLTEHSAGTLTSQAFMKKMNRKNELLAKSAEQLAVIADWKSPSSYPRRKLSNGWELVLGSQVHDLLPGTAIPKAYEYAWNDELVAANGFATVLKNALAISAKDLNTNVPGKVVVVYNPLAIERQDIVEAEIIFDKMPESITVTGPDGKTESAQIIKKEDKKVKFIFMANVPSVGLAVYAVQPGSTAQGASRALKVTDHTLENEYYRVTLNSQGNIASLFDKINNRETLIKPAQLDFQSEISYEWPAWNMKWIDRQKPPINYLNEVTAMRVVENGPLRVSLEVTRKGMNSEISQVLSLSVGPGGKRVEINNIINWQSKGVSLKASFPLVASNEKATYNLGTGTIERSINNRKKFEVPSNQWFDQTDATGRFGISILEDCKYGSDKPDANTLRLTLMYTPQTDTRYVVQSSQDWGIHQFKYGLYPHNGSWREALSPWQGAYLNQPLLAFETEKHSGRDGKSVTFLQLSTSQIGLMAYKKMETGDYYIVRVNELVGKDANSATIKFPAAITDAYEVDGQENRKGSADFKGKILNFDLGLYGIKTFAIKLASAPIMASVTPQSFVKLPYDLDAFSFDENRDDGKLDGRYSIPAELIADTITSEGVNFSMGNRKDGQNNAVSCKGQKIDLPQGNYNTLYVLAAATKNDIIGQFKIDDKFQQVPIQKWFGYIGQFYSRNFELDEVTVKSINTPYIKKDNIAWFASHRHLGYPSKNDAYVYSYMYKYKIKLPPNAKAITLPLNDNIKIFAITLTKDEVPDSHPLQPLYDEFDYAKKVEVRK
jgi:alpha-mannosidase